MAAAAPPQLNMIKHGSPFQVGDLIVLMGSTDVQMVQNGRFNVEPVAEMRGRGISAPKSTGAITHYVKDFFNNVPEGTRSIFVGTSAAHIFNPEAQRNKENETVSKKTIKRINRIRGDGPFAKLSGTRMSKMDIVGESSKGVKKYNRGRDKADQAKAFGLPMEYLQALVKGAEVRGIDFYLENRDSQNPMEGGSWATAILKFLLEVQKEMFPSLFTEENDAPLKALVDIGGEGFTINMVEKDGESEVKLIKNMPQVEKDGKKVKGAKLDLKMNDFLANIQQGNSNADKVLVQIARRLDAYGLGKDAENKVGLAFSGDVRNGNEVELLSKISEGLKVLGFEFAECSFISNENELNYQAQMIYQTHYGAAAQRSVRFAEKVVYHDAVKDDIEKFLEVLPQRLIGPPVNEHCFTVTRDVKTYSGAEIFGSMIKVILLIVILPITLIALIMREVNRSNAKIVVYEPGAAQIEAQEGSGVASGVDADAEIDVEETGEETDVEEIDTADAEELEKLEDVYKEAYAAYTVAKTAAAEAGETAAVAAVAVSEAGVAMRIAKATGETEKEAELNATYEAAKAALAVAGDASIAAGIVSRFAMHTENAADAAFHCRQRELSAARAAAADVIETNEEVKTED